MNCQVIAQPILAGEPAVLVTVRGGNYRAGTPREGWDHATGWMRRILADVWNLDVNVVEAETTLVGINPALDRFTDLARTRWSADGCARRTTSDPWFVTSDQWKSAPRRATLG